LARWLRRMLAPRRADDELAGDLFEPERVTDPLLVGGAQSVDGEDRLRTPNA
jgi:hypothetical protein